MRSHRKPETVVEDERQDFYRVIPELIPIELTPLDGRFRMDWPLVAIDIQKLEEEIAKLRLIRVRRAIELTLLGLNQSQIASKFFVSRERARQLISKGIRMLKHPDRLKKFDLR